MQIKQQSPSHEPLVLQAHLALWPFGHSRYGQHSHARSGSGCSFD
jgi:hypothetical protein